MTELREEDLKVDTYSSGATLRMRMTHLPTGKVVDCGTYHSVLDARKDCLLQLTKRMSEDD